MSMQEMNRRSAKWILLCLMFCSQGVIAQNQSKIHGQGKAQVWITSGDQTHLLSQEKEVVITTSAGSDQPSISIDTTQIFQPVDGFGAALTGSSAYMINKKMSESQREELLKELFDPAAGIGITYVRMTMGASDFSLADFSYDDMPSGQTDYDLLNFSLSQDRDDLIPVFKQILGIAPQLKIMGTPWSPPAWMKTNGNMKGGKLKTDSYDAYARYFVKYIEAYAAEGIAIDAVTPQNEPLFSTAGYPCMDMPATDQLAFVKNNLGPLFKSKGIRTHIAVYDHNWDVPDYSLTILRDPTARSFVAGSAFHAYSGDVSAMASVHNAFPDKDLFFTEISGGKWAPVFGDNLLWNTRNIFIGTMNNWSRNALMWNLALDEHFGPRNNGCQDCRGVVTINSATGLVTRNVEYYAIGHFSKFVRPGAHRIASTSFDSGTQLDNVAFLNADGGKVLVVLNSGDKPQSFTVKLQNRQFAYAIMARSVATFIWK